MGLRCRARAKNRESSQTAECTSGMHYATDLHSAPVQIHGNAGGPARERGGRLAFLGPLGREGVVYGESGHAMSANTLHITNGDAVLHLWKKAGLLGTHLAWRDMLHEGPVPAGLSLEQLSRVRADYLASRGLGNAIKLHHDFEKRDATIRRAGEFEEIVLWFEHDLYDQLHVLQILAALNEQGLGAGSVQIVQCENYLGMLSADEIMALYPKRRFLTSVMAEAAAQAWRRFTSDSPEQLHAAAQERYVGFPFMGAALHRLCEEYPATGSGLSRTQKHVLETCALGARQKDDIFRRSQAREEASFLGDSACYAHIDDLCADPAPLLSALDTGYELTVLGRRVLAGDADWLEHQPLDRWIGGTHLTAENPWRWDEATERILQGDAAARSERAPSDS